jgi:L-fucose isomerase
VYLAAALAGHTQKGLPCFGIYGRDVQDGGDESFPADVEEKILRFVRAGIAAATMPGNSYLALGGVSMGIAGSIVDQPFFEQYLGLRVESADMSEVNRRIAKHIFDLDEYERALLWTRSNCPEGRDWNTDDKKRGRARLDFEWETSVKMALIARDLMVGNPKLAEMGYHEEAEGHNAVAGGFQGQRQWTDSMPNGDYMEAVLTSSFDWDGVRQPYVLATENDSLNAVSMLFGHLVTGSAQLFSDVRTYWSPAAVERVTGHKLSGVAEEGIIHLINSGPSALDWTGRALQNGQPSVKPWWGMTDADVESCLAATEWCPSITEYFPGGGWSTDFLTMGGMPVTMCRVNLVGGLGPVLQIAEGWTVDLPEAVHKVLDERTNPSWPTTWFVPRLTGSSPYTSVYDVMAAWGANHGAISYGHIGQDLVTLASMLRIPVDMHNCDTVFRPSSWARFGAMDAQAADFRACETYGPLFR